MIIKNRFSLFIATFLIIGIFFLALPEKGYSGFSVLPGCCIGPTGACVNFGGGAVACQIGSEVFDGICSMEGQGGICSNVISKSTAVPTLSEWGLVAMASILGIVGFMVLRRKKVTAQNKVHVNNIKIKG